MKIDTVLFDLDGTLIDTTELIFKSFEHTLEHFFPGKFRREEMLSFLGPPLVDTFKKIDASRVDELVKHYQKHNHAHHDMYAKKFDGVYETVKTLHEKGFKLGVVTSKMKKGAKMGLQFMKLEPFFSTVITFEDVKCVKPHPEPILKALDELRSRPETALMVGDSDHDILGGKNAGTKTAGVSWSAKGEDFLRSFAPDFMLTNMRDLLSIVGVNEP